MHTKNSPLSPSCAQSCARIRRAGAAASSSIGISAATEATRCGELLAATYAHCCSGVVEHWAAATSRATCDNVLGKNHRVVLRIRGVQHRGRQCGVRADFDKKRPRTLRISCLWAMDDTGMHDEPRRTIRSVITLGEHLPNFSVHCSEPCRCMHPTEVGEPTDHTLGGAELERNAVQLACRIEVPENVVDCELHACMVKRMLGVATLRGGNGAVARDDRRIPMEPVARGGALAHNAPYLVSRHRIARPIACTRAHSKLMPQTPESQLGCGIRSAPARETTTTGTTGRGYVGRGQTFIHRRCQDAATPAAIPFCRSQNWCESSIEPKVLSHPKRMTIEETVTGEGWNIRDEPSSSRCGMTVASMRPYGTLRAHKSRRAWRLHNKQPGKGTP